MSWRLISVEKSLTRREHPEQTQYPIAEDSESHETCGGSLDSLFFGNKPKSPIMASMESSRTKFRLESPCPTGSPNFPMSLASFLTASCFQPMKNTCPQEM
ncbi:hypothetical protein Ahy_A09g043836 isoform D [Arachis hypogaea]|uniref:Uncharacterized protein n=1 Tax=Arachis hypogaea TaxID=3818 RepID=A0A445BJ26_ARAHY|nr:hypothetical protein Ahy_A09g043836 isoform D [Arachis hypogaea]